MRCEGEKEVRAVPVLWTVLWGPRTGLGFMRRRGWLGTRGDSGRPAGPLHVLDHGELPAGWLASTARRPHACFSYPISEGCGGGNEKILALVVVAGPPRAATLCRQPTRRLRAKCLPIAGKSEDRKVSKTATAS